MKLKQAGSENIGVTVSLKGVGVYFYIMPE